VTAAADDHSADAAGGDSHSVSAGRVGRAHGLDGSFYVTGARPRLLALETTVRVAGQNARVVRRAGTDEHPIVRLEGHGDRRAAEALRGLELTVDLAEAPALEEGEWWASELEGCEVLDGARRVGTVARLVELPSCEALEVRPVTMDSGNAPRPGGALLIPLVRDAIRKVDVARRRIDVDMSFLGEI
jgi:16S rRNA processing protein RimM